MLAARAQAVRKDKVANAEPATIALEKDFHWLNASKPAGFGWMTQSLHPSGAVGDASKASADKGQTALAHGAKAFVELLREMERFDFGGPARRTRGLASSAASPDMISNCVSADADEQPGQTHAARDHHHRRRAHGRARRIIADRGYQNRSEAIRDLARSGIRQAAETLDKQRECVAALVYVYDHGARQLSKRLADTFHDHHECRSPRCMPISTMTIAWR